MMETGRIIWKVWFGWKLEQGAAKWECADTVVVLVGEARRHMTRESTSHLARTEEAGAVAVVVACGARHRQLSIDCFPFQPLTPSQATIRLVWNHRIGRSAPGDLQPAVRDWFILSYRYNRCLRMLVGRHHVNVIHVGVFRKHMTKSNDAYWKDRGNSTWWPAPILYYSNYHFRPMGLERPNGRHRHSPFKHGSTS